MAQIINSGVKDSLSQMVALLCYEYNLIRLSPLKHKWNVVLNVLYYM